MGVIFSGQIRHGMDLPIDPAPEGGLRQMRHLSDAVPLNPSTDLATDAYRLLLDEVGAFVYTSDLAGRYTYANRLVLAMLGHPLDYVLGKDFSHFFGHDGIDDALSETDRRVMYAGETIAREETHQLPNGTVRTFWSIKKPLHDAAGVVCGLLGISYDITEKKQLEDKLREQKTLLDAVLNNIDALIYMKDANRRFLYANQQAAQIIGAPVERIVGSLDTDLMPREVADGFWAKDQHIIASQQRHTSEETFVDAQGRRHHYWSVVVPWTPVSGTPAVIGMSTDITALHELKEELQRQARTDSLTGCANRRSFLETAEHEFVRSRRQATPLCQIAIDLDHFKQINDAYGHPIGDLVLQDFSACCRTALREVDVLARTGGEEFCILLPDTDITAAHAIAERIRIMTRDCRPSPAHPNLQVTASFGVSALATTDSDFQTLFARADRALYLAKDQGRDCVVVLQATTETLR
jgi:diguanylate cyclase (GGDEF)-like protein/PAS domain S-box-containing protein